MAIFNNPFKKNNTTNSSNVPILGRQSEEVDDVIDDELPSVNRRKGKSKLIDIIGFVSLIGVGLVMVYYINTEKPKNIEEAAKKQIVVANRLPPLQLPEPPPPPAIAVPDASSAKGQQNVVQPIPLQNANQQGGNGTPKQTWLDRRMGGNVTLSNLSGGASGSNGDKSQSAQSGDLIHTAAAADVPNPLALKLKPTVSPGVSANLLPDRDYLITKGTALDCALETAIDSTVPGITTCRLTRDVYSDNGHVVLLDRGSQLVGEYQGGITAGQARIFVLWTRAKTPNGVIVSLDSPGTDALGRAGVPGWVDSHFMERFGAAIIMSLVKDGIVAARNNSNTSVTIGGGGSDQIATEILKNTVNIPPTLYVNQGDHVQVMVARDLDFSTVYGLELKE